MFLYRYIHENYYLDQIEAEIEDIVTECASLVSELEMIEVEENMNMYFGEATDEETTNKKEGIFTKIGNGVIALFKKIKDIIVHSSTWIADKIGGIGNRVNRAEKILAKNPALSKEVNDMIIEAVKNGDLNIRDMNDLNKFLQESKGLIEQINAGKLNPDKGLTMFDKVLNAFESGKAQRTIGAATTVIGVATSILSIKKTYTDLMNKSNQARTMKLALDATKFEERAKSGSAAWNAVMKISNKMVEVVNKDGAKDRKATGVILKVFNKIGNVAKSQDQKFREKNARNMADTDKKIERYNDSISRRIPNAQNKNGKK